MARRGRKNPLEKGGKFKSQEYPGVTHYRDRHGTLRWRYRSKGFTVNLGKEYGSDEFLRRYTAAMQGKRLPSKGATGRTSQAPLGSPLLPAGQHALIELVHSWYSSPHFTGLGDSTRRDYRLVAEKLVEEHADAAVEELTAGVVRRLVHAKADTPEAANKLLRILRLIMDHAKDDLEWVDHNPARDVKKLKPKSNSGYHTWSEDEIATYNKRWPEGSLADLALAIMLYTGAARADAVQLGPDNILGEGAIRRIRYFRQKMKTRNGVEINIPLHRDLARRLDRLTPTPETFLQTEAGEERSAAGLGNSMRRWCDAAGLPDCASHGLRKACARRLAEAGATPHEIMAVTGHQTLAEVERYTKDAARAGLADQAINKLDKGA